MLHTTVEFPSLELYLFSYQYIDVLVISPCPFPFLPRKAHRSGVLFHAKQSRLWISSKRSRRPIFILERCHCKCSKCAERQRNYAYGSRVTAVTSVNPASLMTETITLKLDASRPRRFTRVNSMKNGRRRCDTRQRPLGWLPAESRHLLVRNITGRA